MERVNAARVRLPPPAPSARSSAIGNIISIDEVLLMKADTHAAAVISASAIRRGLRRTHSGASSTATRRRWRPTSSIAWARIMPPSMRKISGSA